MSQRLCVWTGGHWGIGLFIKTVSLLGKKIKMNNDEWLIEGIKTKAGKELVIYMNKHFGSSVWGKVIEGVKDIEKELGDG